MITVSVPGKVYLMGEHAVVYGKPALLAAINLRMQVRVEILSTSKRKGNVSIQTSEPVEYVRFAVEKVREQFQIDRLPPLTITISSDIPAGYHLGSSAAVAVGTVGALSYALKHIWNPQAINQLAFEVEKKQHGNPSGGDNTAVTFGGFLWYRKELDFLKSMWQLPFKLPKALDHFYLIDTGRPKETTGEMVGYVSAKCKTPFGKTQGKQSAKYEKLFNENENQTRKIAKAIKEENEKDLIDAMQSGERTLEGMGVVSQKVIPIIRDMEKAGGTAKILGGGGRKDGVGFLLGYHRDGKEIAHIAQQYKYAVQPIQLGEEGVRLEKK